MAAAAKGGRACGVVVVIVSVVTALAGCGTPVSRFLAGSSSAASTTTTAIFQATGPLSVSVSPAEGPAGTAFHLRVTGLVASDVATFSIAATGGHPYTGPSTSPGLMGPSRRCTRRPHRTRRVCTSCSPIRQAGGGPSPVSGWTLPLAEVLPGFGARSAVEASECHVAGHAPTGGQSGPPCLSQPVGAWLLSAAPDRDAQPSCCVYRGTATLDRDPRPRGWRVPPMTRGRRRCRSTRSEERRAKSRE